MLELYSIRIDIPSDIFEIFLDLWLKITRQDGYSAGDKRRTPQCLLCCGAGRRTYCHLGISRSALVACHLCQVMEKGHFLDHIMIVDRHTFGDTDRLSSSLLQEIGNAGSDERADPFVL